MQGAVKVNGIESWRGMLFDGNLELCEVDTKREISSGYSLPLVCVLGFIPLSLILRKPLKHYMNSQKAKRTFIIYS